MNLLWNGQDRFGLFTNIAVAVSAALSANAIIYLAGWEGSPQEADPPFAPPGWVVGAVWTGLFAALGASRWLTLRSAKPDAERNARWLVFLLALCWVYPLYTAGLSNRLVGLIGNIGTAAVAAGVAMRVWPYSSLAAGLVSVVVLWLMFATVLVAWQLEHSL